MKIVRCDNFNRETVAEGLVADNIQNEREGKIMLEALQTSCGPPSSDWYKLVPDDYKLWGEMEEFVQCPAS